MRKMRKWINKIKAAIQLVSTMLKNYLKKKEPKFREMISHLSKDATEMLPKSGNTVRRWILDEFKYQRNILIEVFRQARSQIHLSLDIWITPSGNRSYLGHTGVMQMEICATPSSNFLKSKVDITVSTLRNASSMSSKNMVSARKPGISRWTTQAITPRR
jgi:hypothetical protein